MYLRRFWPWTPQYCLLCTYYVIYSDRAHLWRSFALNIRSVPQLVVELRHLAWPVPIRAPAPHVSKSFLDLQTKILFVMYLLCIYSNRADVWRSFALTIRSGAQLVAELRHLAWPVPMRAPAPHVSKTFLALDTAILFVMYLLCYIFG